MAGPVAERAHGRRETPFVSGRDARPGDFPRATGSRLESDSPSRAETAKLKKIARTERTRPTPQGATGASPGAVRRHRIECGNHRLGAGENRRIEIATAGTQRDPDRLHLEARHDRGVPRVVEKSECLRGRPGVHQACQRCAAGQRRT
jgi:hypothetical protein